MIHALNPSYFLKTVSLEKLLPLLKKHGFTHVDYSPASRKEDCLALAEKDRALLDANGITVEQSHAPYNRYGQHGTVAEYRVHLDRCVEACAVLGAKYLVVHGDEFENDTMTYTPEAAADYNYELFAPVVERAAKYGYGVAFETVFQDWDRPRHCAKFEELYGLITRFNTPIVTCCWDTGHAGVAFGDDQPEMIRRMGSLITCTHIHDCGHKQDLHQVPFHGDIDWASTMKAFGDIGYKGALTYELVYGTIPEALTDPTLALLKDTADLLESYR